MLSVTHLGFTTWMAFLDVNNLCVFEPLRPWDVRICVAPDGVILVDHEGRDGSKGIQLGLTKPDRRLA